MLSRLRRAADSLWAGIADRLSAGLGRGVGCLERCVVVVADRPGDREAAGWGERDSPDVGGAVALEAVDDAAGLLVLVAGAHEDAGGAGVGGDVRHLCLSDRWMAAEAAEYLGDGRVPVDGRPLLSPGPVGEVEVPWGAGDDVREHVPWAAAGCDRDRSAP